MNDEGQWVKVRDLRLAFGNLSNLCEGLEHILLTEAEVFSYTVETYTLEQIKAHLPMIGFLTIKGQSGWAARIRPKDIGSIVYAWPLETKEDAKAMASLLGFALKKDD